ncbi:lytic transglycosylase domain-containing protein [Paraburkholderia megapolitana]|uniref:lytic transglycosylase domain-containing protein n=1 Tax=Paraburkholderia megapolitana TaxID=420953 RepID=UPI0038B9B7E8
MHGINALNGMAGARLRLASVLKAAFVTIVFLLAGFSPVTNAQSIPAPMVTSDSAADTAAAPIAPELDDIVSALCAQFRVTRADSIKIAHAVLTEANRYGMSPVLLLAVMAVESGFNRHAVSVAGARGLMQILPAAHPQLLARAGDLSDPATNVHLGSAILRGYLDDADGDLGAALHRYSGGGRGYARRVDQRMQQFNAHFQSVANANPTANPTAATKPFLYTAWHPEDSAGQ